MMRRGVLACLACAGWILVAVACGAGDTPDATGLAPMDGDAAVAPSAVESAAPRRRPSVDVDASDATRMQVKVMGCMPVGYGEACGCEVWSRRTVPEKARLEVCVGSPGPDGLYERVGSASGIGRPSAELWMDVVPASETERYCGILILESGAHLRVVDFERAP